VIVGKGVAIDTTEGGGEFLPRLVVDAGRAAHQALGCELQRPQLVLEVPSARAFLGGGELEQRQFRRRVHALDLLG
jgi:hypothetical protein